MAPAVLGCDIATLMDDSKCLLCLSDWHLLAAEVLVREQFFADGAGLPARPIDELLDASVRWQQLADHDRKAIEVRQLCNEAVIVGARTDCSAEALVAETKCYCGASQSQLEAIVYYLKCLQRQT